MKVGLRFSLAGALVLVSLSGCGRGFFQQAERAPWRHEAEVACMKSGEVKLGQGVVQIEPIEGPGACGADFPLRVTTLGESSALGFADEVRPPAPVPSGANADMPRWPPPAPRYASPPPADHLRWVVGPPAVNAPDVAAPAGEPMSLAAPDATPSPPPYSAPRVVTPLPSYSVPRVAAPPPPYAAPRMAARPPVAPEPSARPDDIPPDAVIPPGGSAAVPEGSAQPSYREPPSRRAYNAPVYEPVPQPRELPRLGPARRLTPVAIPQATLTPPATLSCPIVSALDRWVSEGVQPAALRWLGSPVTSIKQIGSYSCRSMVGAASHHISEHAFGDALDIAGFTFADGRTITVKNGWHGSPEEQGFLHDVQLYACQTFDTVLAPGYNPEHYNHIHVDLMRRSSGRRPCQPNAIPGEVVAARVRAHYASRQRAPTYTGSIAAMIDKDAKAPVAVPGADGYVTDDDDDANVTGSIPRPSTPARPAVERPQDRLTQIY